MGKKVAEAKARYNAAQEEQGAADRSADDERIEKAEKEVEEATAQRKAAIDDAAVVATETAEVVARYQAVKIVAIEAGERYQAASNEENEMVDKAAQMAGRYEALLHTDLKQTVMQ